MEPLLDPTAPVTANRHLPAPVFLAPCLDRPNRLISAQNSALSKCKQRRQAHQHVWGLIMFPPVC